MSVNKVILVGNVGIEPNVKNLSETSKVVNFTVATSETFTSQDGSKKTLTEWHNIVAWNGVAGIIEKYVKKGDQIYLEGKSKTRSYTDQSEQKHYITEVFVDTIQLLNNKPKAD